MNHRVSFPLALVLTLGLGVGCASQKAEQVEDEPAAEAPAAAAPAEAAPAEAASAEAAPAAKATLGNPAPDFTLTDVDGKEVTLSSFKGKTIVLEWYNPDCPYVRYAHGEAGPLASMPQRYIEQGVVWLAINSGAEGKQGSGVGNNMKARDSYGITYPVLMDTSGEVGRLYEAMTTPHMFVIDRGFNLVYNGALDNAPRGEVQGDAAVNHIDNVFAALSAGEAVAEARTKPYGCGVKY